MKNIILLSLLLLFYGCDNKAKINTTKPTIKLDGKSLVQSKCSKCHNIDFPPKDFKDEIAPAIMTISFHFNDWFKAPSDTEKLEKQLDFISDYIINPTVEKSYCDKTMLKKYGLMPSQKGNVTTDEIRAIGKYIFKNYTQEKLSKKEEALEKLHSLPIGEQITIKYHCSSCHKIDKNLVGPSFQSIGLKYKNDLNRIKTSIKNGSKNTWKISRGATMPSFSTISDEELNNLAKWMKDLN